MKIKTKTLSFDKVSALSKERIYRPKKPNILFRTLLKILAIPDLLATNFKCERIGMEKLSKGEPCLVLMNHSSFIDLKIITSLWFPKPLNIVCTSDGFVGKNWLMRNLGCIPTKKFITDTRLVKNMIYALKELKSSVLLYPEASYSFDGTATPLPESLGKCLKLLRVPVVACITEGAFLRDPLYNGLQLRKTKVSAKLQYILSPKEIEEKTVEEINNILNKHFSFDNFRTQQEKNVIIKEKFRADGLNRVLYRCPHCETEGYMKGKGTEIICKNCKISYTLTENGFLTCNNGKTIFSHIPDWYNWQRECVRKELLNGSYKLDTAVDIMMMVDTRCIYKVGDGRLIHTSDGFKLTGCEGKLDFKLKPIESYSLYADYFWYEIGDVICIGNSKALYYCFPKTEKDIVAKTRLATEELYKITKTGRD